MIMNTTSTIHFTLQLILLTILIFGFKGNGWTVYKLSLFYTVFGLK